jgi:hypothetical protein
MKSSLTLEESLAELASKVEEMMAWADEMEALEPGEGRQIVAEQAERKREQLNKTPRDYWWNK